MLIRDHDDATQDEARWRSFVQRQGFGHFVAAGRHRDVPVVVPTQFLLHGERIIFHLARANPVLHCLADNPRALLSVAGDWAYIPGAWKAIDEEDPHTGIPTTYYGAVQLIGTVTVVEDPDDIAAIVRTQRAALEPEGGYADPLHHGPQLRAIRGITLDIEEVRAKFKYGGNVDQAHRDHVASQLRIRGGPGDAAAIAQLHRGH